MAWELWRQDDNGNAFQVEVFATEAEALAKKHELESSSHRQIYWVSPRLAGP